MEMYRPELFGRKETAETTSAPSSSSSSYNTSSSETYTAPMYRTDGDKAIPTAKIKVVGVGGGGGNAVNRMIKSGLQGVEFWAMNTDAQVLAVSETSNRVRIGEKVTGGLGCGSDPSKGEKAAEESKDEILKALDGANMVFITAGMGGGTGTGAAPVVAQVAKDVNALTIAVVSKPFGFEGKKRMNIALQGIEKLKEIVDAIIVIPNEKLLNVLEKKATVNEAFHAVDQILMRGVQGISDIITFAGDINVDFADVEAVMKSSGSAIMGIGRASGEGRAVEAAKNAISHSLLETSIVGASGVIVNITGGPDLTIAEVCEANQIIQDAISEDATYIFGQVTDDRIQGDIQITVIATGFELKNSEDRPFMNDKLSFPTGGIVDPLGGMLNSSGPMPSNSSSMGFSSANMQNAKVRKEKAADMLDLPPFFQK